MQRTNQSLKDLLIFYLYMWSCGSLKEEDVQAGSPSLIDFTEWLGTKYYSGIVALVVSFSS